MNVFYNPKLKAKMQNYYNGKEIRIYTVLLAIAVCLVMIVVFGITLI